MRDVPDPVAPEDGVVVRVDATGLCRSDWHAWVGHDDDVRLPHVPGHELAGTILEVGRDVGRWQPGQRVIMPFIGACGVCPQCRAGNAQVCDDQRQPGFHTWGSFAERVALGRADANLVELPDAIEPRDAAILGCRFATAYRAVVTQGRLAPGEWVAVHGCGGVGLSAVMIAAAHGARVVAVDLAPAALDAARALGADAVVAAGSLAAGTDAASVVRDITGGGAHLSIDALGSVATSLGSIGSLRKRGRHVQVGLMVAESAVAPVPMNTVMARELELIGSHGMAAAEYPRMLAAIVEGRLAPGRLVGATIGLEEAPAALVAMSRPATTAGITVILPNR
ncbi:MAG TPA: alcohol dehydrogenase catalytic domain-containing protein [Candidatus Limnocylindrales bacterium]|nr:alcohol dehydrogenase catalytic domain-containing protein [Candidatus Limnocylindrales bacterium]